MRGQLDVLACCGAEVAMFVVDELRIRYRDLQLDLTYVLKPLCRARVPSSICLYSGNVVKPENIDAPTCWLGGRSEPVDEPCPRAGGYKITADRLSESALEQTSSRTPVRDVQYWAEQNPELWAL
jgi:hypothetical protein